MNFRQNDRNATCTRNADLVKKPRGGGAILDGKATETWLLPVCHKLGTNYNKTAIQDANASQNSFSSTREPSLEPYILR